MIKFPVYPELIAKIIKENELDLYLIWVFCKKINTNGSGIVEVANLLQIATFLFNIKSNHIYKKVENGVDKYWGSIFIKNNKRFVCLYSNKKLVNRLQPEIYKTKPFLIPYSFFDKLPDRNYKTIKSIFVSLVAGRYDDDRPVSIEALTHQLNLSESTIRNALKESIIITRKNNFIDMGERRIIDDLYSKPNDKIVISDGTVRLFRQLPNSYSIDCFSRMSIKSRPKELKINDRKLDNTTYKKYSVRDNQIFLDNKIVVNSYNR